MKIINLSVFDACPAMLAAGVFESARKPEIASLQSFWLYTEPLARAFLCKQAENLAFIAKKEGADHAVVDVPSYFVEILSKALKDQGIVPVAPFYHDFVIGKKFKGWILI